MPTIAIRDTVQLSLFGPQDTETAVTVPAQPVTITIPVPVPAPAKAVPAPQKKKPVINEKKQLEAIMQEKDFKESLDFIKANCDPINLQELFKRMEIDEYAINNVEIGWNHVANTCYQNSWHFINPNTSTKKRYVACNDIKGTCRILQSKNEYDYDDEEHRMRHEMCLNIAYVSVENANPVIIPLKVVMYESLNHNYMVVDSMEIGKVTLSKKVYNNLFFIQKDQDIIDIAKSKKPWLLPWMSENYAEENSGNDYENNLPSKYGMLMVQCYLAHPWLETLHKAGYKEIVNSTIKHDQNYLKDNIEAKELFNRLCQPGTKPKDIFKCSKTLYTTLKNNDDLHIWDVLRRLEKKETITGDSIQIIYNLGVDYKEMDKINSILGKKYNDKPVFTVASLVNYFNRLDMYEAIRLREALPLLSDYLNMCHQLNIPPRVDSDSLKREHDIAARLCREQHNKELEQKMKEKAEREEKEKAEGESKLARATYYENIFFIRPITEYNDLLDEAIQQSNCVASYAQAIAEGRTRIFTMRYTAAPNKSLITIELSPDCVTIRQKYLAHNQPIRNKAMSDFIARWHKQLNDPTATPQNTPPTL